MWEDPIVAEVHRIREKLAAEFGFDIGAIFADLRKRQASLGDRLVHPKKRAEPAAEAERERRFRLFGVRVLRGDPRRLSFLPTRPLFASLRRTHRKPIGVRTLPLNPHPA